MLIVWVSKASFQKLFFSITFRAVMDFMKNFVVNNICIYFVIWWVSVTSAHAMSAYDDIINLSKHGEDFIEGENIDGFSGELSWRVKDATFPGTGLDINIYREYGLTSYPTNMGEWNLLTPRVAIVIERKDTYCGQCVDDFDLQSVVIEIPGASRQPMVKAANSKNWISINNSTGWVAEPTIVGGKISLIAYSPQGAKYEFNYSEIEDVTSLKNANISINATRVSDGFGNYINYEYMRYPSGNNYLVGGECANNNSSSCVGAMKIKRNIVSPTKILASDGREVTFSHKKRYAHEVGGESYYIQSMSVTENELVRTWYFKYSEEEAHSALLDRVIYPDNSSWEYKYRLFDESFELSSVKYPTGASIYYTYATIYQNKNPFGNGIQRGVVRRILNFSGNGLTTDYTYSFIDEGYPYVAVSLLDNGVSKIERKYICAASPIFKVNGVAVNDPYFGVLYEKNIVDSVSGEVMRKYKYDYVLLNQRGSFYTGSDKNVTYVAYPYSFPLRVAKVEVDGKYTTSYSDFDEYYYPQKIVEGNGRSERITLLEYKHTKKGVDASLRYIGMISGKTILGDQNKKWTTMRSYDDSGKLTSQTDNGITENYTYFSSGELATKTYFNESGAQTIKYEQYYRGYPRYEKYPDGSEVLRDINDAGTINWEKDAEGNVKTYGYDLMNRVSRLEIPGLSGVNIYYGFNNVVITQDDSGSRREISLDGLGRPILYKRSGLNIRDVYENVSYDKLGREIFRSYPSEDLREEKGVRTEYDSLGRPLSIVNNADGSSERFCYGKKCVSYSLGLVYDDLHSVLDSYGNITYYLLEGVGDPDEMKLKYIKRSGKTISISRNKKGDIVYVQQGNLERYYNYADGTSLVSDVVELPEGRRSTFYYDQSGNVISKKVLEEGESYYTYDSMNRLKRIVFPNASTNGDESPSINYEYNNNGQLKKSSKGNIEHTYKYTSWGSIDSDTIKVLSEVFLLDYDYDKQGKLSKITYPNGFVLDYLRDDWGRPTKVGEYVADISYYPSGKVRSYKYGNGQVISYDLDSSGRIEREQSRGSFSIPIDHEYSYYGNGRLYKSLDNLNSLNSIKGISYFEGGAPKSVSMASGIASYTYDKSDNLTVSQINGLKGYQFTYSKGKLEKVAGAESLDYKYNVYGAAVDNGHFKMIYDQAGEMIKVLGDDFSLDYVYDDRGHRVMEISEEKAIWQVRNPEGAVLYEKDLIGDVESMYIYFDKKIVAKVDSCTYKDSDKDGVSDCKERQLGFDPLNSTDVIADDDGDGLNNIMEIKIGTNPRSEDTDNDGIPDGWEIRFGLNPLRDDSSEDADRDGESNYMEYQKGTNPLDPLNIPVAAILLPSLYLLLN
ncbi:RHS repeat protein [Hahella sp. KA22]|uniref:RHS repeat protein n=1 Tax=Hahella sp. KA22 TaxID=1628392 RepID=UPI000FDF5349|nr:RHS repeat protein [Hahella sp. KA22]AZZ92100.1 RHS repeat protein [Hahella sp. KA22]QAY55470.1 RHS repeat protein [Hahella sp. KA22]